MTLPLSESYDGYANIFLSIRISYLNSWLIRTRVHTKTIIASGNRKDTRFNNCKLETIGQFDEE
jgi:hypothetical protein